MTTDPDLQLSSGHRRCVSATSNLLTDELVVLTMRPDPEPMCPARHWKTQRPIVQTDSNAMKPTIPNSLEM